MPRAEPNARVKKLEEAQARLNAELQRARGRLAQENRKRDTHRKILAGAMTLDRVARGEVSEQRFLEDMDRFLDKDRDRAVYDLPPRAAAQQTQPPAKAKS